MRIAVFGTGGIGGYFGGRLAKAGLPVVFVARGEHLRALRREGLHVESVAGDFTVRPVHATDDAAAAGAADFVLLAVKSWQVHEAARALLPSLGPDTAVVTLQNGVEAPWQLAEVVGRERVLPGTVRVFSQVAGPGHVRHGGGPGSIAFGEWDGRESGRVRRLRDAFAGAGVPVETPDDVQAALWRKFLFVVPMGGIGAVARAPVGVLRSMPGTRRLLEEAMREILAVARARGVALPADGVEETMAFVDAQPAAGTSSLQRDLAAGRRSELDAWVGAVVRFGEQAGVDVPVHRFVHACLLPLEARARREVEFAD
ncbi:MAG TPA: 2-dehydropantoate 2-reductase [Longimicrobiaceae bacterium]|nr:2-dehydropantoate 2-reductase [Longimicrobiaceae bacterium]